MSQVAAAGAAVGAGSGATAGASAAPEVQFGPDGLVPAIVQDALSGRVLMLAWMDAEALAATVETGDVHFHSRSRDRLWRKGETSGNVLRLVGLAVDCDADALLVTADPAGPTCHRGTRSCFDPADVPADPADAPADSPAVAAARTADDSPAGVHPRLDAPAVGAATLQLPAPADRATQGFDWLEILWSTIAARATDRPDGSYTTSLLDGGVDAVGRKVTEEATELLLAAKDDAAASTLATREALAAEAADLLYHSLVLLAERDLPPAAVIDTLRARHVP